MSLFVIIGELVEEPKAGIGALVLLFLVIMGVSKCNSCSEKIEEPQINERVTTEYQTEVYILDDDQNNKTSVVTHDDITKPILGDWWGFQYKDCLKYSVRLYNSKGQLNIEYPFYRCSGTLTLVDYDLNSHVFIFIENITKGTKNCVSGTQITFQKVSDENIDLWFRYGADIITGDLYPF